MGTVIITDSCSDLPEEFIVKNNIPVIRMSYQFKGSEYEDDGGKSIKYNEFYDAMRNGELPTTSQINVYRYKEVFKKYIEAGQSIIYIGFSSALTGSLNNAGIAKKMLLDEYKDADISIIDSKSASMGEGLIVYNAVKLLNEGKSKSEIVNWIEENKLKINHWFTVSDLNNLKRGGRISVTSAFIGTMLAIKPVLNVDNEGRLIPITKVKGRKKSLRMLADNFKKMAVHPENQTVFISHCDCIEDAEHLKKLIQDENTVGDIKITYIGPIIGSHSGPGTVAVFFFGNNR